MADNCSRGTLPCIAMPRNSVMATSLRPISFSAAAGEMPMPKTGAPSRRPRKIVPGLAPITERLLDREQRAGAALLLLHQQRVAVDHIGAGILLAFEREQFFVIGAQMRGAIEHMGDEGRLAQRIFFEC